MEALEITEAQQVLERALAKYPDDVNVLDSLGELLFSLGEVERAITVIVKVSVIVAYKVGKVRA